MISFGTGGWRAIIADGFTKANVQLLAASLADLICEKGEAKKGICIGYDRRFMSKEAAVWAAETLAAYGVVCYMLDQEAPTPLIMFSVKALNLPWGMAITASHNPAIYNGIKVFTTGGRDAVKDVTDDLENRAAWLESSGKIASMYYEDAVRTGLIRMTSTTNDYIDSILRMVDIEAIKNAHLKVVIDPLYGVSKTCLSTILVTARCEVDMIHTRRDTLFGGKLPAPTEDTLQSLAMFITDNKIDIGVATDGDADRIGVIDDAGQYIEPNKLLVLLYYYLLKYKGWRGDAVRNNSTTSLLDRVAEAFGQKCHEVPVGFKYISAKMQETDAIIGGESSGGMTVRGHISGKDGIYAATLLVEMQAVTGKRLSELYREITDQFGSRVTVDHDYKMTPERKEELREKLYIRKELPELPFEAERTAFNDGCKVYFKNGGWVICRFSGTEPLLRICSEMPDRKNAERCVRTFEKFLRLQKD